MKTDTVEIFQTIRALLQPYTTKGFASRTNSETLYDLWSDQQLNSNGEKVDLSFFASVAIKDDVAMLRIADESEEDSATKIEKLDDETLDEINNSLVQAFTKFKHKG